MHLSLFSLPLLLLAVSPLIESVVLSGSTDLKVYVAAMIASGDVCKDVVGNVDYTVVSKTCRSSCNYPDGICVSEFNKRDVFAAGSFKCVSVPSSCQASVKAEAGSSSSSGGSQTSGPRPTARPTDRPTRAPVTSAPSSGGGSKCTGRADAGRRTSGVRFSRPFYFDGRSCKSFLYWGVGGNDNRHETKAACESECLRASVTNTGSSSNSGSSIAHSKADCSLPSREGAVTRSSRKSCNGSERRYSYLTTRSLSFCTSFTFSNCPGDGNKNNFESKDECEQVCGRRSRG
jgi:hypothetical protein